MKKQLSTFAKGAAVVVPLSGVIPQGESCAWFGENFFKNILWYLGYLNPVYWWKCCFKVEQGGFCNSESLKNEQRVIQKKLNKKSNITRESALKRFKELCKEFEDSKGELWPKLELCDRNKDLVFLAKNYNVQFDIYEEGVDNQTTSVYAIRFEEDKVSFCALKSKEEILYSISFDDSGFDEKLLKLVDHLRKINWFLGNLGDMNLECDCTSGGNEWKFVPSEDMWYGGDKSFGKLVSITLSSDYRSVTFETQEEVYGLPDQTAYELSSPEGANDIFSVCRDYKPAPFCYESVNLEKYETDD